MSDSVWFYAHLNGRDYITPEDIELLEERARILASPEGKGIVLA